MGTSVRLLVGTKKGAFVYTADALRKEWELSAPMLPGWSVYTMVADSRGASPRFYMGANHWAWGPSIAKSADLGENWDWVSQGLGFPEDMGAAIQNVWCITPGLEQEEGVVYCGTQPAGLFKSEDWGVSWAQVDGINRHEQRKYWSGTGRRKRI